MSIAPNSSEFWPDKGYLNGFNSKANLVDDPEIRNLFQLLIQKSSIFHEVKGKKNEKKYSL